MRDENGNEDEKQKWKWKLNGKLFKMSMIINGYGFGLVWS